MNKRVKVILGSVRSERAGINIAEWVMKEVKEYQGHLDFEFIDLKDLGLPFMDEPMSPMASDKYVHSHTKKWSQTIKDSDAFIFITPEYNHGYSPVLKNAIDFLFKEWKDKPAGFVGYGGSGARGSIRQLREVFNFIGLKVMEEQVGIGKIWEAVDEKGDVKKENIRGSLLTLLSQIEEN